MMLEYEYKLAETESYKIYNNLIMDIIYKMYFNVIWILLFGLFYIMYFYFKKRNDLITLSNFLAFLFSSLSILGGLRIFHTKIMRY